MAAHTPAPSPLGRRPAISAGSNLIRSDVSCRLCPRGSVCSGGLLVPADGFWHSFPESEDVQLCPNPVACSRSQSPVLSRSEALLLFQKEALKNSGRPFAVSTTELVASGLFPLDAYRDLQCAEGYTGPLCAMCKPGFGRRRSVDCVKCPSQATVYLTYAVLLLFNLCGLALALRTSLVQSRRHSGSFPPLMNQVLKIILSFLMCTSLILRVQSSWPKEVAQMLSLASLLGLTVDVVSIECVFGPNLFFTKLLGYVLIIPAGALLAFLLLGVFYPFVRAPPWPAHVPLFETACAAHHLTSHGGSCDALLPPALMYLFRLGERSNAQRRAYDDLAEMERAFHRWRGEPLIRCAVSLLSSDGGIEHLLPPRRVGPDAAQVSPAPAEKWAEAPESTRSAAPPAGKAATGERPALFEPHSFEEARPGPAHSRASDAETTLQRHDSAGAMPARARLLFVEKLRHVLQLSKAEATELLDDLPGPAEAGDTEVMTGYGISGPRSLSAETDDTILPSASHFNRGAGESDGGSARSIQQQQQQQRRARPIWETVGDFLGTLELNAALWFVRKEGELTRLTLSHLVDIVVAINVIGIYFMCGRCCCRRCRSRFSWYLAFSVHGSGLAHACTAAERVNRLAPRLGICRWLPVTMVLLELFNCTLIDTGVGLPLPSPYTGYWLVQVR